VCNFPGVEIMLVSIQEPGRLAVSPVASPLQVGSDGPKDHHVGNLFEELEGLSEKTPVQSLAIEGKRNGMGSDLLANIGKASGLFLHRARQTEPYHLQIRHHGLEKNRAVAFAELFVDVLQQPFSLPLAIS